MFDKEKFKILVEKARGNRSNSEYARESNVSRTYISQSINESLENPPSPEILKDLADKAHNDVTYIDLMEAVGYLEEIKLKNEINISGNSIKNIEYLELLNEKEDIKTLIDEVKDLKKHKIESIINFIKIWKE